MADLSADSLDIAEMVAEPDKFDVTIPTDAESLSDLRRRSRQVPGTEVALAF